MAIDSRDAAEIQSRLPVLQHNSTENQTSNIPTNPIVQIPPSQMFGYPTRLMCVWEPRIMQINLPERIQPAPRMEVAIRQDSTQSLGIQSNRFYKWFLKRITPPIQMGNQSIYDGRYETDGNIAHLLGCIIDKVLIAQTIVSECAPTLILRSNATTMAKTVCKTLGIPLICTDREIYGNLVIVKDLTGGASVTTIDPQYAKLFMDLEFAGYRSDTPSRVFIARKGDRSLQNEYEIEQVLRDYGFQKYYYEDIPINQQWSISRNADVIVAMHGAALSSLLFNRKQAKVLELFHPGYVVDVYRDLTHAIGGTWAAVLGQLSPDVIQKLDFEQRPRAFARSRAKIDPISLQMALNYLNVGKLNVGRL